MDERTTVEVKDSINKMVVTAAEDPTKLSITDALVSLVAEEDADHLMIFAEVLNLYQKAMHKIRKNGYFKAEDVYNMLGQYHTIFKSVSRVDEVDEVTSTGANHEESVTR